VVAAAGKWLTVAHQLICNRVTTKQPEVVAVLLADYAVDMWPTAIANKHDVHHVVVRKVCEAANSCNPS
jgi:hypothetical protein